MIKLFRRIRQRLLSENRLSEYLLYAIGEIVLVVIGILIALSINTWNEGRKDKNQELVILKSLRVNLEENLKLLELANTATLDAYNASLRLHELTNPDVGNVDADQIESLMSVMLDYFAFDANSGAIYEIINSGQLSIIRNDQLKNQISSWSGLVEDTQRDVDIANQFAFGTLVVYLTTQGGVGNLPIGTRMAERIGLEQKPESSFAVDYHDLMSSPEFENMVGWHSSNLIYILNEYVYFKARIESMIDLIDAETKED